MSGKAPAFQHFTIHIDPVSFYFKTMTLDCSELGSVMRSIFEKGRNGKFDDILDEYPFIVRINKGWLKRKSIPLEIRRKVLSHGKCMYCGENEGLTVDHIIPVSKGGPDSEENFQCLCSSCNRKKGPERGSK